MGALAASTSSGNWLVEDDILLKNAIETGASLESLAKGAVCFSHKFTLQELKDRWTSMLYNPAISTQASARMVEYETELSTSNPVKAHRLFNSKAKDFSFQKRKIDTVKNLYYAMRKKACIEPCSANDLGFLISPCSCMATGGECICGALLKPSHDHHVVQNIEPGIRPMSSYEQVGGSYNGAQPIHPEINGHSFDTQHAGNMNKHGDATNNAAYVHSDVVQIYDQHSYTQKIPETSEADNVSLRGITNFQDSMQFQQLASSSQCGNKVSESKALVFTDEDGIEHVHIPGNNDTGVLEPCSHHLIHQSEGPQAPCGAIWDGVEERDTLALADSNKTKTVNRGPLTLQANSDGGICMPCLDHATMPEGDFMDFPFFSNSDDFELLNGENFLNSPHEPNQEDLEDTDTEVALGTSSAIQNLLHPDEANICCDQLDTDHVQHNVVGVSGMILVPASPEVTYPDQYVECKLNTEDPEIPCNDDTIKHGEFSPQRRTTTSGRNSEQYVFPFSPVASPPSKTEHSNVSDLTQIKRDNIANAQPSLQPMKLSPSTSVKKEGSVALHNGYVLGTKLPEGPSTTGVLMHGDTNDADTCMISLPVNASGSGEGLPCNLGKHDCFDNSQNSVLCNSVQGPERMNYNSKDNQPNFGDGTALQNCMPSHALSDLGLQDPIATVPTSAQVDECSDPENVVPNYYDLEALILDQDLIPWDQDSDLIHPEVSKFQNPESRKSLIRLEQGAQSYLNRAIMSRCAFAVVYGLHFKYYIKDPEVTLGRETEDVKVHIDLAKEGRANKISRRQAVIKMDEAGSFHIKNIGKCSIFVNSKEVPCSKGINLSSSSLIEIKDMRLIFHVYQDALRQYLARNPKLVYSTRPGF